MVNQLINDEQVEEREVSWSTKEAWQALIIFIALEVIFSFIVAAIGQSIKLPSPIIMGFLSLLLYAGLVLVIYLFSKGRFDQIRFTKFPVGNVFGFIILFFTGILVFESLYALLLQLLKVKPPDNSIPIIKTFGTSTTSLIVIFLLTVIVAPVIEELFFRGFLYQAFRKRYGVNLGIIISALIFGLFHGLLVGLPIFFVIGAFLGYLFEKYHSIYPSIILHAVNNFFFFIILLTSTMS